jgi:hypothetical protein
MLSLAKYITFFLLLNLVLNAVVRFNPLLGYLLYFGFIIYWFKGFRLKSRSFKSYTQTQEKPKPKNMGDVIDVEYTEHKEN